MIALLDADIIAYRSAASCEPTKIKPEREPLDVAIQRCNELVLRILHETNADSYKAFIGGDVNFRYSIDPTYKANRADKPKPIYLQEVRAYLVTEFNAEICDGIEADDALGIHQTSNWNQFSEYNPLNTIICSIDKDLLMIPGYHYNFVKQEQIFVHVLDGIKNFYQQLILGDQSDNIMGYDGKARSVIPKFLQIPIDTMRSMRSEAEMFTFVRNMYHDDERLLRTGRLLWICRESPEERWSFPLN